MNESLRLHRSNLHFENHLQNLEPNHTLLRVLDPDHLTQLMVANETIPRDSHLRSITPLKGGINSEFSGGGVYSLNFEGDSGHDNLPKIVLKTFAPFVDQQNALYESLEYQGFGEFIQILKNYPSNRISQREIMCYSSLRDQIPLAMPNFHLGIVNESTEEAWMFIEDISQDDPFTYRVSQDGVDETKIAIKSLSNLHSKFWGKTDNLVDKGLLGKWWDGRESDFSSLEVAKYAVEHCLRDHSDILTPHRLSVIHQAMDKFDDLRQGFSVGPQTLIHWDFGGHNLRIRNSTPFNTDVVAFDWELASIGWPQWDLVQLLLPEFDADDERTIDDYLQYYLSCLPTDIQSTLNLETFKEHFDLVVIDHFYKLCGPILFDGISTQKTGRIYREWIHCLEWIEHRSARRLELA